MRMLFASALILSSTGCQTLLNTETETLSEPNGNGALAIATVIKKHDSNYPCEAFSLDLHQKIEGKLTNSGPQTLRLFTYENKNYALFDGITPGNYVLTQVRCNIQQGFVADGKSFLGIDLEVDYTIKADTVTISPYFIYAIQKNDGSFGIQIASLPKEANTQFHKELTKEVSGKWALR